MQSCDVGYVGVSMSGREWTRTRSSAISTSGSGRCLLSSQITSQYPHMVRDHRDQSKHQHTDETWTKTNGKLMKLILIIVLLHFHNTVQCTADMEWRMMVMMMMMKSLVSAHWSMHQPSSLQSVIEMCLTLSEYASYNLDSLLTEMTSP